MSVSSDVTTVTNPLVARGSEAPQPLTTESQWDKTTKRTVLLVLLVISAGLLWLSRPAIPLLAISGIVSYLLSPIVDLAERIRIPRYITTIILYMLVLIGLILLPFLLIPVLLEQLRSITDFDVYRTATSFIIWVTAWLNRIPDTIQFLGLEIPVGETLAEFQQNFEQTITVPNLVDLLYSLQQLAGTATSVVGSTASIGISVVGSILQGFVLFILTFFMSLYLTKDAPLIQAYVQDLFPRSFQPELSELIRRIRYVWHSFFRGQLLLCITIGVITWVALELVGMPGALILAIIAGALEIIPNLGPTLATIPAVIVALIQGSDVLASYGIGNLGFAVITLAIYFIIQQLENSIIVPRVIGNSVNLHPIVIICGVVIGFNLAGIWGAFFAAPVIASLRIIGGYVHAKLLEYVPFQDDYFPPATRRRSFIYRRRLTGDELNHPPTRPHPPAADGDPRSETTSDDIATKG